MREQSLPEKAGLRYEDLPESFHRRIQKYSENWEFAVTPTAVAWFESIEAQYPHLWPEVVRRVFKTDVSSGVFKIRQQLWRSGNGQTA